MHTDNKSKQLKVQNTLDARKRILDLHMQLILHVSTCQSTKCPSKNCAKMKGLFKHRVDCNIAGSVSVSGHLFSSMPRGVRKYSVLYQPAWQFVSGTTQ